MKRLALVSFLLVVGAAGLFAQVFDFKLINKTGYSIHYVYVSPSDAEDWGDDVLGTDDLLANKKSVDIEFPSAIEALLLAFNVDKYDLKVEYEDETSDEWYDLKLEEISELTLTLDKKGNGVATWK